MMFNLASINKREQTNPMIRVNAFPMNLVKDERGRAETPQLRSGNHGNNSITNILISTARK